MACGEGPLLASIEAYGVQRVKGEFYKTVAIIRKNLMRSTWKDACNRRLSWHLEDQEKFP